MNQPLKMEQLLRLLHGGGAESEDSSFPIQQEPQQGYDNEQLMALLGFDKAPIKSNSKSTVGIRG
jgi:hypothetical protein